MYSSICATAASGRVNTAAHAITAISGGLILVGVVVQAFVLLELEDTIK